MKKHLEIDDKTAAKVQAYANKYHNGTWTKACNELLEKGLKREVKRERD